MKENSLNTSLHQGKTEPPHRPNGGDQGGGVSYKVRLPLSI